MEEASYTGRDVWDIELGAWEHELTYGGRRMAFLLCPAVIRILLSLRPSPLVQFNWRME